MGNEQESILRVLVQLRDEISEPLKRINEDFEEFSSAANGWWNSAAEVFAGYETIEGLVEPASAMQEHMVDIAQATHASREELQRYKETAEELAASLPVKGGAEEIADAMAELYKTFRDNNSLKEQTEIVARMAVVMKGDASTSAMVLASAVQNLGDAHKPATEQMQRFADQLAVIRDRFPAGSAGLQRMAMDFRMLGTAAQTYNVGQTSMLALLAEANRLHLGGLRGSGPILEQVVSGLLKVGKDGQTEMAKYGLQIVKTNDGHVNLIKTLEQMSKMSPVALRALERQLPGQAQSISLLVKHLDDLKEAYNEVDKSAGELAESSSAHAATFASKMQILSNSFSNLRDTLASSGLLDGLTAVVNGLSHLVGATDKFLTVHPAFARAISLTITGFAGMLSLAGLWKFATITVDVAKLAGELLRLGTVFSMLGDAWAAAQLVIEGGIGSLGGALGLLFESNPVGWIITALAVVGVLSYEIWKHWDDIKSSINDARFALDKFMRGFGISPNQWQGAIGKGWNDIPSVWVYHHFINPEKASPAGLASSLSGGGGHTFNFAPHIEVHGMARAVAKEGESAVKEAESLANHLKEHLESMWRSWLYGENRDRMMDATGNGGTV